MSIGGAATEVNEKMNYSKSSIVIGLAAAGLILVSDASYADIVDNAGAFFLGYTPTSSSQYKGTFTKTKNSIRRDQRSNNYAINETVTMLNRCTFQHDFNRPPNRPSKSESVTVDLTNWKRPYYLTGKTRLDNESKNFETAIKLTGIKVCALSDVVYRNPQIPPHGCSDTYFHLPSLEPDKQKASFKRLIAYCHR